MNPDLKFKNIPFSRDAEPQTLGPVERILCGELLGNVIQELTGKDIRVVRTDPSYQNLPTGVLCTYATQAFCGDLLVGIANVTWRGEGAFFEQLRQRRMKAFLNEKAATPQVNSYHRDSGELARTFTISIPEGTLTIVEQLFLHQVNEACNNGFTTKST